MKHPPEVGFANSNNLGPREGDRTGSLMQNPGPRMAVMVVVLTATRDYMGIVGEYNGLLVYY